MKKSLFVIMVIFICGSATATTKCVQIPICDSYNYGHDHNKPNWDSNCTPKFGGVGICSSTDGTTPGAAANVIYQSTDLTANKSCWCKMTYPFESRFIFKGTMDTAEDCLFYCSADCQGHAVNDSTLFDLKNFVFSNPAH